MPRRQFMLLEVATFPVRDVLLGSRTRLDGDVLEIDEHELLGIVRQDPYVDEVKLELAKPGEPKRLIEYENVIEPKVKVQGAGTPYPGVCGRPTELVGEGRTHRLSGLAVVEFLDLSDRPESAIGEARQWGRRDNSTSADKGARKV
jgi:hypothetical protein